MPPDYDPDAPRTVARTRVEMTEIILPQFTNALGNVFGGQVMAWIDICGAVAAQRHCRGTVVTASIDEVHFISPIREGAILTLHGQVNAVFRSSLETGVSVIAEDPFTGTRHQAAKAYATFVALDNGGRPRKVPSLVYETDQDRRRGEDAHARRAHRLAMRKERQAQAKDRA